MCTKLGENKLQLFLFETMYMITIHAYRYREKGGRGSSYRMIKLYLNPEIITKVTSAL